MTLSADVMAHEGECYTSEVATAAKASNNSIGIFTSHLHLLFSLQTDDSLVQTNVVEYRT